MDRKTLKEIMDECNKNGILPFIDETMCYTYMSKQECMSTIRKKYKNTGIKGFIHSKSKNIKQTLEDLAEEGSTFIHYEIVSFTDEDMFHFVKYLFRMNNYFVHDDGAKVLSVLVESRDVNGIYIPNLCDEDEGDVGDGDDEGDVGHDMGGYDEGDDDVYDNDDVSVDVGDGVSEESDDDIVEINHSYNKMKENVNDITDVLNNAKKMQEEHENQVNKENDDRILLQTTNLTPKEQLQKEKERLEYIKKRDSGIVKSGEIQCNVCGKQVKKNYLKRHQQTKKCQKSI